MTATTAAPQMQVFAEFPDSNFSGFVPVFHDYVGELEGRMYASFKLFSTKDISYEKSFDDVINDRHVASVLYENGVVKSIYVFEDWLTSYSKAGVTDYMLRSQSDEGNILNKDIKVIKLSNNGYLKLIKMMSPLIGINVPLKA